MLKKILIIAILSLMAMSVAIGVYVFALLEQIPAYEFEGAESVEESVATNQETLEEPQNDSASAPLVDNSVSVTAEPEAEIPKLPVNSEIISVLIFGIDRDSATERGRTDTIMVATIDNKNSKLKLTSLMRDLYVAIPGRSSNRLNAAYAFGGPELAIRTINENFGMNISKYVAVDFLGFERIIDMLGGIEIELSPAEASLMKEEGITKAGMQILNGRQALFYSRIRKVGRSDFGRVDRQQQVLTNLFGQFSSTSVIRIPILLNSILPHLITNMSALEILNYSRMVLGIQDTTIHRFRLPVDSEYRPETIRGMMVLVPNLKRNVELFHEFLTGY